MTGRIHRHGAAVSETERLASHVPGFDADLWWDLSLDLLAIADQDGRFFAVNPAWERVLGWNAVELTSRSYLDFVHPDDVAATRERARQLTTAGAGVVDFACRYRTATGDYRLLDWVARSTPDGSLIYAAARDVTARRAAAAQVAEVQNFGTAMEYSATGMCLTDTGGAFISVNSAMCDMLGSTREELIGATWQQMTHPDDLVTDLAIRRRLLAGTLDRYHVLKRYLRADGSTLWADLAVGTVRNDDGSVRHFVSQIADATARVAAEQVAADHAALLRVVLDSSNDATMRLDRDLRVQYVNKRVVMLSGRTAGAWSGHTFAEMGYSTDLTDDWDARHRKVIETGIATRYEFEIDNSEGHRWYETSVVPEHGDEGRVTDLVVTSRDITDRKETEADLVRLATHDTLTGLTNRLGMMDEIARSLLAGQRSQRPTGVLMVDLDRFKNVNDSLGHAFGDVLLQLAAERMTTVVRGGDLVARPGGDEFVVVMRDLQEPLEAFQAAWRLVEAFRAPFTVMGSELFATASIGVAVSSKTSLTDDLVREADTALYVAKAEGRDRVSVFNERLRAEVTERLTLEGELRHALSREELVVWFQPEIDLSTGMMGAAEALLRWNHPGGTMLDAVSFIELAEDTGLILDIGDWVLAEACEQAARWSRGTAGQPLVVRVNVSALQLAEMGLLDAIDSALERSGVDPSLLCIEITETALLRSTTSAQENLAGIRERGIQIAADDFGTGYASLAYLLEYPVDVLKIDRSFVTDLVSSERSRRLVTGILALADALGITVTAEGVEEPEQARILLELGCPGAQGFLYSKAVAAEHITLLRGHPFLRP